MKRNEKAKAGPKFRVGQKVLIEVTNGRGESGWCYAVEKRAGGYLVNSSAYGERQWYPGKSIRPVESGQRQRKGSK